MALVQKTPDAPLRQPSCLNVSPFLPCVHKAVAHLQKLQRSLSSWPDRVQMNVMPVSEEESNTSSSSITPLGPKKISEELEVTGTAFGRRTEFSANVTQETGFSHEEIFEEVYTLVSKLDDDCRETEEQFREETLRRDQLTVQLEELLEGRLRSLPAAVQAEHEACAMDIAELQWHVAYQSRALDRQRAAAHAAARRNQSLKEDVDYMREHCPQVEAKLALEREEMSKLSKDQRETLDQLHQAKYKLMEMEERRAQTYGRVEQQRSFTELELNRVKDDLKEVSDEYDKVMAKLNGNIQERNASLSKLSMDERTHQALDEKYRMCKQAGCQAEDNVIELKRRLFRLAAEQAKIAAKNDGLVGVMEEERERLLKEKNVYAGKVKEVKANLKKTLEKNQQLDDDMVNMKREIILCEEKASKDEKTAKRSDRDEATLKEQLKVSLEEAQTVQKEYEESWAEVRGLEEESEDQRNSLQVTLDTLKQQLSEEVHVKTSYEAKIKHDSTDMTEFQAETTKKLQKSSEKARRFEERNALLSKETEQMRAALAIRKEAVSGLRKSLEEMQSKHETTEGFLASRRAELAMREEQLKVEVEQREKERQSVDWRIEKLEKKLEELTGSVKIVKKLEDDAMVAIKKMKERSEEKMELLKAGREEEKQLRDELKEIEDYHQTVQEKHGTYMEERREVLETLKENVEKELINNGLLAETYCKEQELHMQAKARLMETMDHRFELESSIRDHKQLMKLQLQMHSALEEYYQLRGMFHEQCYMNCCKKSSQNGQHLDLVEVRFRRALEEIRDFLHGGQQSRSSQRDVAVPQACQQSQRNNLPSALVSQCS